MKFWRLWSDIGKAASLRLGNADPGADAVAFASITKYAAEERRRYHGQVSLPHRPDAALSLLIRWGVRALL